MTKFKITLRHWSVLLVTLVFVLPNLWSIYFNQNFVYPKMIALDFILALVPLLLAFEKNLRLPPKNILILAGLLCLTRAIPLALTFNWVTGYSYVLSLGFGLLCLYIMTVWQNHELSLGTFFWPFVATTYSISVFVFYQFTLSRLINGNPDPLYYSGPFGNINMMSEYLIFLLPLGLIYLRTMEGWRSWVLQIGVTAWITILLVGQSRSAWMGLALCFGYGAWRRLTKKEWASYTIAMVLFLIVQSLPYKGGDYAEAKSGSFAKRLTLYHGATRMLADQPIGVGGGEFEYGYIPYQITTQEAPVEREKFNTPHNEFFKWGIENGWAYLILICGWWLTLGTLVWKIRASRDLQTFYRSSFLVLGPQMFFQFPFENPASYVAIAFLISLILVAGKTQEWPLKKWSRALAVVVSLLLFVKAGTQAASRWLESQYANDRSGLEAACPLDRSNWRVCFLYSMALMDYYPDDAKKVIQTQLIQRPFDYHALRALVFYNITKKQIKDACEVSRVYDSLFLGTSLFTPFIKDNCGPYQNPVPFQSAEQFNRDYRAWLKKYLD